MDSEEDDAEGDGEGDCEGDVSDSNWKDDEYYAPQHTDRSNFSVDEAKAEINKVLAGEGGGGVPSSVEEPKKENRDWRSAMAAMDDYLSQNKYPRSCGKRATLLCTGNMSFVDYLEPVREMMLIKS